MALYHLRTTLVRRRKRSVVGLTAYIVGAILHDSRNHRTYDRRYHDGPILEAKVMLPATVPEEYTNIQFLLDSLNAAEKRRDAQMARHYDMALPIELSLEQHIELAEDFLRRHFLSRGQCAIYAIHYNAPNYRGRGAIEPIDEIRDNPHLHVIVPFRGMDEHGFQPTKLSSRDTNNRFYLIALRRDWADHQNRWFEQLSLDVRVSHKSLRAQGIERPAAFPLEASEMALERQGIRTARGDHYRNIMTRIRIYELDHEMEHEHIHEFGLGR